MEPISVSGSSSTKGSWSSRRTTSGGPGIIRERNSRNSLPISHISSRRSYRVVLSVESRNRKRVPRHSSHTPNEPQESPPYNLRRSSRQVPESISRSDDSECQPLTGILPTPLISPKIAENHAHLERFREPSPESLQQLRSSCSNPTMQPPDTAGNSTDVFKLIQTHHKASPSCHSIVSCRPQSTMDYVVEEHVGLPTTLEKLTPELLQYISSITDRRYVIKNVTPDQYAEWIYKPEHSNLLSDRRYRFSYCGFSSVFIVECTSSLHQAFTNFFVNCGARRVGHLTGGTRSEIYFEGATSAVEDFTAAEGEDGASYTRKYPDGCVQILEQEEPSIVIEVGFSEDFPQLKKDAELYLTQKEGKIKTVIILDIKETDPAETAGQDQYLDETGAPLSFNEAKRRKFIKPNGFTEQGLLMPNGARLLKNYYLDQDSARKLIPRLLGNIDCTIHVYRPRKEFDNQGAASTGVQEGDNRANTGDEKIECTFTSTFMIGNEFVNDLPPEKQILSFTLQELVGNAPLPDNLKDKADYVFTWPLKEFYDYLRKSPGPWRKMHEERAIKRANKVIDDIKKAKQEREEKAASNAIKEMREQGLRSGTKETRKDRVSKRGLADIDSGDKVGTDGNGEEAFEQDNKRGRMSEGEDDEEEEEEEEEEENHDEEYEVKRKPRRRSNRSQSARSGIKRETRSKTR